MLRSMRLSTIALAALALTTTPLAAQNVFGLHAGASIATFGGADAGSPGSRTGLNVGASLTMPVSSTLGFQIGASYAQKGATDSSGGIDATLALDYIEVPLLLRIGIPSTGSLSAHLLAGPAVSFEAKCTAKGSSGGVNVSVDCGQLAAAIRTVDVGAMGGVGLDIGAAGKTSVSIDVLYNFGLTSIVGNGVDTKNRALTIQAGVGVPMG